MRYIALFTFLVLLSCNAQHEKDAGSFTIEVYNPLNNSRENILVSLARSELPEAFSPEGFVVREGDNPVPAQFTKATGELMFVIDKLEAKEKVEFFVRSSDEHVAFVKRTQAELSVKVGGEFKNNKYIGGVFKNVNFLRVPDEHTDHSSYVRYEGPGWESDKIAYRFYLDWRNAMDIFGKTTEKMVLQQVGQEGSGSYHELQPWGMDVLKVGESLGVGSLGIFDSGRAKRVDKTDSIVTRVLDNGVVFSGIATDYYGWQLGEQIFNIHSELTIHAGTRLTKHDVTVDGKPDNLCTGIGKDENAKLYLSEGDKDHWGYMATYGPQSLNNDRLGLAVLFPVDRFIEFTADAHSHVVKLKPDTGKLSYYFLAAWEREPGGIATEKEFLEYIEYTARTLAHPVKINVK